MRYTAVVQGERIQIDLTRHINGTITAEIDGRTYALQAKTVEPGVYWLNWKSKSLEIAVTPNGEGYVVSLAGRRVLVELVDSRKALRRATQHGLEGAIEVRAPMPGKIVKLLVAEGAEVQLGQGILVMEAMKMQNEIKSPKKGIIRRLPVKEGAAVSSGDVLAAVE